MTGFYRRLLVVSLISLGGGLAAHENTLNIPSPLLSRIGFDQKLDAPVDRGLAFRDERGANVRLGDYLGKRPLVLALVYYRCPHLCKLVVEGLVRSFQAVAFSAGMEFEVALVSIDPTETPADASARKRTALRAYTRVTGEKGFHFLTGDEASIHALAEEVGFRYTYDEKSKEFAHASGIMVLTPEGKISRYLYGIDFPARSLRLALVEAARGEIGTPVDRFLLFCYHYDPIGGRYGLYILNVLRLAGVVTCLLLLGLVVMMLRAERKRPAGAEC